MFIEDSKESGLMLQVIGAVILTYILMTAFLILFVYEMTYLLAAGITIAVIVGALLMLIGERWQNRKYKKPKGKK